MPTHIANSSQGHPKLMPNSLKTETPTDTKLIQKWAHDRTFTNSVHDLCFALQVLHMVSKDVMVCTICAMMKQFQADRIPLHWKLRIDQHHPTHPGTEMPSENQNHKRLKNSVRKSNNSSNVWTLPIINGFSNISETWGSWKSTEPYKYESSRWRDE